MPFYHEVVQGEHISSIADKYGIRDYRLVWADGNNSELRKLRGNPNVLYPGDRVFVPDQKPGERQCATDKRHTFEVNTVPLKLRVKLERVLSDPFANAKCDFQIGADVFHVTTDGSGQMAHRIPTAAHTGTISIEDKIEVQGQTIPVRIVAPVRIGDLDPVNEKTGQVARLANLGYYRGPTDKPDQSELLSAIEEFQCDNKLVVDGICGPKTQAMLKEVHGS